MIPYLNIRFPSIPIPLLGDLTIHAFGILVAAGILVGMRLTHRRGRELGLTDENVDSMITHILISGFLFAHYFDVFAYQTFGGHPSWRQILNPLDGFSSFGGFIGAVGGLLYWCWKRRQPIMPYADS